MFRTQNLQYLRPPMVKLFRYFTTHEMFWLISQFVIPEISWKYLLYHFWLYFVKLLLYQFLLYLKKLGISKIGITKKLKYNIKNGGITKKNQCPVLTLSARREAPSLMGRVGRMGRSRKLSFNFLHTLWIYK